MIMRQLALPLAQPRAIPRQQPAIERLRAILTRQGFDWRYRALKGSVLLRPLLASRFGWQCMCGRYCCGDRTFERVNGYFDRSPLTHEEREAWAKWREEVWRTSVHELWGAP